LQYILHLEQVKVSRIWRTA